MRRQQNSNISRAKQHHIPTKTTANPGGLFHWAADLRGGGDDWIGIRQLLVATSLSAATVARLVDCGRFPPPLMRGRVRLWRVADIRMWIADPAAYRVIPSSGASESTGYHVAHQPCDS